MVSVTDIHGKFLNSIEQSRSLFTYCRSPFGQHSNAGVESAFLDGFKSWEVFLDELVFAYLRGESDIAGNPVPAIVSLPSDDQEVYVKVINGGRGGYIDWVNPESDVKPRLKLYFTPPLDDKIDGGLSELKDMLVCRNAIAHASGTAYRKLTGLWERTKGTSAPSTLRCADVLLLEYTSNPPMTLFDRYMQVLEVLSNELVNEPAPTAN